MLSKNSFQRVLILSEKKVKENSPVNILKWLRLQYQMMQTLLFITFLRLMLVIFLICSSEPLGTRFCQIFRIQEQFRSKTEKVAISQYISSTKKFQNNSKNSKISSHHKV